MNKTHNNRQPVIVMAYELAPYSRAIIGVCTPDEAPQKLQELLDTAEAKGWRKIDQNEDEDRGQNAGRLPLPYLVTHCESKGRILQLEFYQL